MIHTLPAVCHEHSLWSNCVVDGPRGGCGREESPCSRSRSPARSPPPSSRRYAHASTCRAGSSSATRPESSRVCPTSTCRSEEHTSELQSPCNLVCRLLLEKKKK